MAVEAGSWGCCGGDGVGFGRAALTLTPDLDDIATGLSGVPACVCASDSGDWLVGRRGGQLTVAIGPVACRRRWIGPGSVGRLVGLRIARASFGSSEILAVCLAGPTPCRLSCSLQRAQRGGSGAAELGSGDAAHCTPVVYGASPVVAAIISRTPVSFKMVLVAFSGRVSSHKEQTVHQACYSRVLGIQDTRHLDDLNLEPTEPLQLAEPNHRLSTTSLSLHRNRQTAPGMGLRVRQDATPPR